MSIRFTRRGFWLVRSGGGAVLHSWKGLAPAVALPLLLLLFLLIAFNRQSGGASQLLRQDLQDEFVRLWQDTNAVAIENLLRMEPVREESELPTLEVSINRRGLEVMQESISRGDFRLGRVAGGKKPYFGGLYRDESGILQSCKVGYRGLGAWHHQPVKPSLRVRIKKSDVRLGRRYVELQRPEDPLALCNSLPEELAREVGLLSNISDPVRLFVNRKYLGVYLRTMRAGEPLALEQGRLPGAFFKGDRFGLWKESARWRRDGVDLVPAELALQRLLDAVGEDAETFAEEDLEDLVRLLDTDAYARFSAVMTVVGSLHTDHNHNQVLFWNTYRGRFEPVVWDANGYGVHARTNCPVDVMNNPITERLSRDPRWVHRRNQELGALLVGVGSEESQHGRIDAAVARMRADLEADPHLGELKTVNRFGSMLEPVASSEIDERQAALKAWITARNSYLRRYLSESQVYVEADSARPGHSRVQVGGAVAVEVGGRVLYPGLSKGSFASDRSFDRLMPFAIPVPLWYSVEGDPATLAFKNAVTGAAVEPRAKPMADRPARTFTLPPPPEPTDPVVLGPGEVTLTKSLHVGPAQRLTVRAGTRVRLGPGVGVYARGQVRIEGRADAPVVFAPLGSRPWACLALSGAATAGSKLQHLEASGGSVGAALDVRYKGMINVYHCPDVEITGCRFGTNSIGDDVVNVAQSKLRMTDTTVDGGRMDGVDLDFVRGVIEGCTFTDCGNDGLDLMGSRVRVSDCTFQRCGDKGLSAGEATRLLLTDSSIEDCKLGLQVKDATMAVVRGTTLSGNGVGVHAYPKKWAYSYGGVAVLEGCTITRSRITDLSLERRSAAWLLDTRVESVGVGRQRVRQVRALPEALRAVVVELKADPELR